MEDDRKWEENFNRTFFHHSVGTFLFLLSKTVLRRTVLSLERPSSVISKENWRKKGCFKKRLIMYSWCFCSSSACFTWKRSWTKRLLTNISTGFQVSSYKWYPKNRSLWKHLSNRNHCFTLAFQYNIQSLCLFPKYTLVCKTPKLLNRGFETSSAATYFFFLEQSYWAVVTQMFCGQSLYARSQMCPVLSKWSQWLHLSSGV